VAVTRQTLVERETVEGTLGYAGNRIVLNRLQGGSSGAEPSGTATAGETSTPTSTTAIAWTTAVSATPASGDTPSKDPESDETGSGDPESDSPGSGDPESDAPRSGDPESGAPGSGDPEPDDPGSGDPESGAPGSGDPAGGDAASGGASSAGGSRSGGPSAGGDDGSGSGSGGGSGTVTALAPPGSFVQRGGVLYRLDGQPVVLMYGSTPAFRALGVGVSDGRDVRQLERNLAALGFDPGTVDETFTSTTAAAVGDWQDSAGLPETGGVELGRVVFLPGARRIGEHKTAVGSVLGAGSEVLETSSTKRVVTVELDAALQSLARRGDGVEVTLPDQSTVRGRITEVGRVAREKESSGADAGTADGAEQELVIDVTVRLRSARGLGRLDEAPVSVGLAQESRGNVLAVPVNALVARRGGGYGVELASGGRIVPVRTGLFAGGYVEVSGSGIREGTRVVVPDA
jgi:hypothetical protein